MDGLHGVQELILLDTEGQLYVFVSLNFLLAS